MKRKRKEDKMTKHIKSTDMVTIDNIVWANLKKLESIWGMTNAATKLNPEAINLHALQNELLNVQTGIAMALEVLERRRK